MIDMEKTARKINYKLIGVLTLLGIIGVVAIFPYQTTVQADLLTNELGDISLPLMIFS